MIGNVRVDEVPALLAFTARIVASSVDAAAESKAFFVENIRRNIERWAEAPGQSVHLKFVEGEALLGVVLVREYWNLCGLFVEPAHQRRGIGTALVREAVARCRSKGVATSIRLNAAYNAVPFYVALGFREVAGSRPVHSAVAMELEL